MLIKACTRFSPYFGISFPITSHTILPFSEDLINWPSSIISLLQIFAWSAPAVLEECEDDEKKNWIFWETFFAISQ